MAMFLEWSFRPTNRLEDMVQNELQTSNKNNHQNSFQDLRRTVLRHRDVEGAARNVLLSPLHSQNIIPLLLDDIRDVVLLIAHMLHGDLFAGRGGTMDPDQQHVGTWEAEEGGYFVRMHPRRQRKRRGYGSQRNDTSYCLLSFYSDAGDLRGGRAG